MGSSQVGDGTHQLEQREITAADCNYIRQKAAEIRRKLGGQPTYEDKRRLLELLAFQATLRIDDPGTWLDVSCGLSTEPKPLLVASNEYHFCR